jgi:hypothetical protein
LVDCKLGGKSPRDIEIEPEGELEEEDGISLFFFSPSLLPLCILLGITSSAVNWSPTVSTCKQGGRPRRGRLKENPKLSWRRPCGRFDTKPPMWKLYPNERCFTPDKIV